MFKTILILVLLSAGAQIFAQVGINTQTPQATLHINGDLQFSKDLNVGGSNNTKGNSGTTNQVLFSQGTNLPPVWNNTEEIQIPQELLFLKKNTKNSVAGGIDYTVTFNNPILTGSKIELNNSSTPSTFKIKKKGNYQITSYVRYEITTPALSQGIAVTKLINTNSSTSSTISGQTSGYQNNTTYIDHNFTYTDEFNVDDIISLVTNYTKAYNILEASISIQYLGN